MEKEQEKHEWKLIILFLIFSLVISVIAIFQQLEKISELEIRNVEQKVLIKESEKVIAEQTKKLAELQKIGG